MAPDSTRPSPGARLRTPENASILAAVALAVPAGTTASVLLHGDVLGFLLLMLVGVSVPTAYRTQWPADGSVPDAVAWTVAVGVLAGAAFLALALGLRVALGSATLASVVAFLVTGLGGPLLLALWLRWRGWSA